MKAGTLVRTARLRQGITQRELARRSRIPQPMISLIERGLQDPRYSTLQRILAWERTEERAHRDRFDPFQSYRSERAGEVEAVAILIAEINRGAGDPSRGGR